MSRAAVGAGNAHDATVRVEHDHTRAIRDLKARLAAVRDLCESTAACSGLLSPADVLTILDRQE